jgi:lysophospholipase
LEEDRYLSFKLSDCKYFTSDKGITIRYHFWRSVQTLPVGTIILLGGRKEFIEKYIETASDLNQMGFDVYSFDWRGQGLSTRMLIDRTKGYIGDYNEYLTDLHLFFDTILPDDIKKPINFLAHSMGAHIVLRFLHDHPSRVDGAILSAPMIDIFTSPYPRWLVKLLIRFAVSINRQDAVVPGSAKRSESEMRFEANPLTSDPRRFQFEKRAVATNSDLAVDAVTFAWLSATMNSIDILKTPGYLEVINTPVLIASAGNDKIVSVKAQKEACRRLPKCLMFVIPDSRHEILMETDVIREKFWRQFRSFTRTE